jgi:hypothetical protein
VPTPSCTPPNAAPVDDAAFLAVVRDSLPYAREVVAAAAADRGGKALR